jgi:hypothetical protein
MIRIKYDTRARFELAVYFSLGMVVSNRCVNDICRVKVQGFVEMANGYGGLLKWNVTGIAK